MGREEGEGEEEEEEVVVVLATQRLWRRCA